MTFWHDGAVVTRTHTSPTACARDGRSFLKSSTQNFGRGPTRGSRPCRPTLRGQWIGCPRPDGLASSDRRVAWWASGHTAYHEALTDTRREWRSGPWIRGRRGCRLLEPRPFLRCTHACTLADPPGGTRRRGRRTASALRNTGEERPVHDLSRFAWPSSIHGLLLLCASLDALRELMLRLHSVERALESPRVARGWVRQALSVLLGPRVGTPLDDLAYPVFPQLLHVAAGLLLIALPGAYVGVA
jgi:hypothetical protein